MSRTTRFLSGVGLGYFSQVVVTIAGLWLTPFLLSRLGGYEYGLWLVSLQLQAYLTLIDFGVLALLSRDIAMSVGKAGGINSATDLQAIVGRSGRLVLWQMPVLALLAAGLWLLMSGEWGTLRWPLGLMLLTFVVLYPLRIFSVMLYGLQDHGFNAKAQFASWLARFHRDDRLRRGRRKTLCAFGGLGRDSSAHAGAGLLAAADQVPDAVAGATAPSGVA